MPISSPHDPLLWVASIVAVYKIASLLVGLCFGYMGYRLFLAGIQHSAGSLEASAGPKTLKLSRGAPGTFFALFGAAVIAATIVQGFDVELPRATRNVQLPKEPPPVTDETNR
jgi:hypothetical protein